jgi:hypothetical protein
LLSTPLTTRDTVEIDTPALRATSVIRTRGGIDSALLTRRFTGTPSRVRCNASGECYTPDGIRRIDR